jgi:16S rRNA (guanine(527)-N(7))-methyltransferase RsmG
VTTLDILLSELLRLGLHLSNDRLQVLARYITELEHWNRSMNLTGLAGAVLIRRLVAEPLWVADRLGPTGRYLDIGSGNGSPAVPWHALCEFHDVVLVESRQRRATFLHRLAKRLKLKDVTVRLSRFENVCSELESVDWVTLQGVTLTVDLLEQIRSMNKNESKIVWLTRAPVVPEKPVVTLDIPDSDRQALVFRQ